MDLMPTIEEIVRSIDNRLEEANQEIVALTSARSALGTDGRTPAEAGPVRRQRHRGKRKPEVVPAAKIEQLLSTSDGLTTSALAQEAYGERDRVLMLLRELEAAGRVRRTGERRGVRWHVITDEDRIRERAAELEKRRMAKRANNG